MTGKAPFLSGLGRLEVDFEPVYTFFFTLVTSKDLVLATWALVEAAYNLLETDEEDLLVTADEDLRGKSSSSANRNLVGPENKTR